MTITLYGIPNCDTVKKARKWLDANGLEYRFHDFRKDGIDTGRIQSWMQSESWEVLLNKRGTTWRQLPDDTKSNVDESNVAQLMAENPTLIKRPVMVTGKQITVGFQEKSWQTLLL